MKGVVTRRTGARAERDKGMSLIELLVAMGIFTFVIAIFMSGVVAMTRNTSQAQAVSDATTAARKALDQFDRQVRDSTAINRPGAGVTGAYYVEYLVPSLAAVGTPVCHQWRYDPIARTLDTRSWADSATPTPSGWSTVATDVRNDLSTPDPPFVFTMAGTPSVRQQLTVTLDIGPAQRAGAQVSATYAARNTSAATTTQNDISPVDGQSDTPVCQAGVGRP